jgi:hypothetical protein
MNGAALFCHVNHFDKPNAIELVMHEPSRSDHGAKIQQNIHRCACRESIAMIIIQD